MAHRGASRAERENTVAAFRRASEMGAEAVELDVRRTSDGVLVVHHNPHLHDGQQVSAITFAAMRSSEEGASVPTLGEALDACAGMWVNVEIKNDPSEPDFDPDDTIADETIAHLVARGSDESWLISSFREETIDRCRALAPQIATAWLCVDIDDDTPTRLAAKGHAAVHPWVRSLTAEQVARCHAQGLQVNTWTVDDPERMAELIAWGIDGICTNVPDVALSVRSAGGAPA
ncbi:MAG: glycerophosphodiester phosphodiesterase [Ilumatobacteraceae bacterium]